MNAITSSVVVLILFQINFSIIFLNSNSTLLFTFNFDIGERKTLSMGDEESTHDSHDDFFRQPRSHDGSSPNTSHQYHQPPSYDGSSANTSHQYHQPSSYAGSSVNTRHQYKQRPTYIADSFSSLDQVFAATFAH